MIERAPNQRLQLASRRQVLSAACLTTLQSPPGQHGADNVSWVHHDEPTITATYLQDNQERAQKPTSLRPVIDPSDFVGLQRLADRL
eukprot:1843184-Rhodomonas_salina.1